MKLSAIEIGGRYVAKVSGKLTTVRVEAIRNRFSYGPTRQVIDVVNETTSRRTTFRSAARLRRRLDDAGE